VDSSRSIAWEGFFNARDLGGLPTRTGGCTRRGAFIRSGDLRFVTPAGWEQATDFGLRTILDLRNEDEIRPSTGPAASELVGSAHVPAPEDGPGFVPAGMQRVEVPLDDVGDTEFWRYLNREGLNGTPLYFRPFLDRKSAQCAAVITAAVQAAPGCVLFHCGAGRDRTGLITLLLLALVDVEPEAIATDYVLTTEPLKALFHALGRDDEGPLIERLLSQRGTTARDAVLETLDGFDAESYLLSAGVRPTDLAEIRRRLLT